MLEIDLGAIAANWRLLATRAAPAACAAVLKADAYGLGAGPVAKALAAAGCRLFFTATLDEGISLRQAIGAAAEIAVLNGPLPNSGKEFVAAQLVPVLNEPGQIAEWRRLAADRLGLPAILHVDTGMARLGLAPREFTALAETLGGPGPVRWRAVMSHLACADDPSHPHNKLQRTRFEAIRRHLPGVPASLAASSGIFLGSDFHFDLVRPGAALYGVNPRPGIPNLLKPTLGLRGKIVQIREIDGGEPVGYGAGHVMAGPGRLATVAVGYADGLLRSLSHRGCGRLAGCRVPLVGRVSMDLAVFDISALPSASVGPGDWIELLGTEYGVNEAARDAGTIGYEVLTALGGRCCRVYRNPSAA